jgi:hypothetical protein
MSEAVSFHSAEEIENVVKRLEACAYEKGEFTHALHLAVAAWYVSRYSNDEALARMRSGLLRLTNKFGVKAYHETITQFWMRVSRHFLSSGENTTSVAESVSQLIAAFGKKDVVYQYYSSTLLQSEEAKNSWVEPDLKPISTVDSGSM